jgi:thiol-disulfide isomerase/thioredoxin
MTGNKLSYLAVYTALVFVSGICIYKAICVPAYGRDMKDHPKRMEEKTACVPGDFETVLLSSNGTFDEEDCRARCLHDKVMMLSSSYCPYCKETEPDFVKACKEKGIKPVILYMSDQGDYDIMKSFGITVDSVPTFIFGCDYYMGAGSVHDYLAAIDRFLSR